MDARRLFDNPTYSDVNIIASGTTIQAHRCVLDVVPFFDAAFRQGPNMKEGQGKILTIQLDRPHTSVLALVKHVYGFRPSECLPNNLGKLLALIVDCEIYDYKPFIFAVWKRVLKLRDEDEEEENENEKITTVERVASIEIAAAHKLPIELEVKDCESLESLSYNAAVYILTNKDTDKRLAHIVEGLCIYFAVMWMKDHRDMVKECHELAELCKPGVPLELLARDRLAKVACDSDLNVPAFRLIVRVLNNPVRGSASAKAITVKSAKDKKPSPPCKKEANDSDDEE